MKYVASFVDGSTTYVIAVDQDGFTHLESRRVDGEGTLKADAIVLGEGAVCDLITALKASAQVL